MPIDARMRAVFDVVDHAYAGVLDRGRWHDALRGFAALLDARAAGVRVESRCGVEQDWVGLEPTFDQAYVAHYWRDDPWATKIWDAPVGAFAHGDALCERALVEASVFHNELALPSGFDDLAGGILERAAGRTVSIGVMKGAGARRFDADDDAVAALITPHFARALALRDRMTALASVAEGAALRENAITSRPSTRELTERVEERLKTRYALTSAEARVAFRIGGGLSPKENAAELGSSWYTVRAQLRHVFMKTDRRSQSSLARLVTLLETELALENATSPSASSRH